MRQLKLPSDDARCSTQFKLVGAHPVRPSEAGFSLVEVVMAMVLFGLVAVAVLPLLIGVTQLTVSNSESVRAKAAIQQRLAVIQADYPTDPALTVNARPAGQTENCATLAAAPVEQPVDGNLTLRTDVGSCPDEYPGTVSVQVSVTNSSGTTVAWSHSSVRVTQ